MKKVTSSRTKRKGKERIYTIEANAFLRYMVRTIIGTFLEIGRGKMEPGMIKEIFKSKKLTLTGPTAPAKGLCLVKIIY